MYVICRYAPESYIAGAVNGKSVVCMYFKTRTSLEAFALLQQRDLFKIRFPDQVGETLLRRRPNRLSQHILADCRGRATSFDVYEPAATVARLL
jgi:hypothetical protein